LQTLNQTLAEGYSNYRDGRLILNKTVGQRFVGRCSIEIDALVDQNTVMQNSRTTPTAQFYSV